VTAETPARPAPSDAHKPRRALASGAALLLVGLAMVGVGSPSPGAIVTSVGVLVVVYGIHTFGRLGPEE
jgi:heme O synthase-like polyprenyltransferase